MGLGGGGFTTITVEKTAGKEKHQLLQGKIYKGEEENRMGENGKVDATRCLDKIGIPGQLKSQMVQLMA